MQNSAIIPSKRWPVVLGALLIQASLGAIYIYSVFKPGLKTHFPSWSATDLALPSQVVLAVFALSMIVSGRIQDRIGPKKTATAGAAFILLGMYVAAKAGTLAQFVLGFGILGGIGIGAAYVCPIAACVKWFPDRRGLVTGLAVAGFGAGGLIFTPLASYLIAAVGIMPTFFYLGLIFFLAIIIGARFLSAAPDGYCPSGWQPPAIAQNFDQKIDFTAQEMIKTGRFWLLWLTYFIGCTAGLLIIMNVTNIWQSITALNGAVGAAALVVILVSIANSLGRIVWGKISDSVGRNKILFLIFAILEATMFVLAFAAGPYLAAAGFAIVGLCFGGLLALYPAITADNFGAKNVGANYGLMFTAYGAGGLLGPWLAPRLMTLSQGATPAGDYSAALLIAGILCLAAALIILFFQPATKNPYR